MAGVGHAQYLKPPPLPENGVLVFHSPRRALRLRDMDRLEILPLSLLRDIVVLRLVRARHWKDAKRSVFKSLDRLSKWSIMVKVCSSCWRCNLVREGDANLYSFNGPCIRQIVNALLEDIKRGPADLLCGVALGAGVTHTPRVRDQVRGVETSSTKRLTKADEP